MSRCYRCIRDHSSRHGCHDCHVLRTRPEYRRRAAAYCRNRSKDPRIRRERAQLLAKFRERYPLANSFYHFRRQLDVDYATGGPIAAYIGALPGYAPPSPCACGAQGRLVYWPTFEIPWAFTRLCAVHKSEVTRLDKRSVRDKCAQMERGSLKIKEVRRAISAIRKEQHGNKDR